MGSQPAHLIRQIARQTAQMQAATGADLFSIQTSVDYPGDIDELIDYASSEQEEDVRPELTLTLRIWMIMTRFLLAIPCGGMIFPR